MLYNELKLGYPSLWLKTTEPSRAIQDLVSYDFRDFYTINFELGFSKYVNNIWRTILIESLDPET